MVSARPGGIDIGRVEEIEAVIEAHIDLAAADLLVDGAPFASKNSLPPPKVRGAEGEDRNFEAGTAELTVFHWIGMPI